jgi:riboflavin kinase/FMN adenylyltransferase
MELIRGVHNLRAEHRGCVATIGNFDGVHRGHHSIFSRLGEISTAMALPSILITFEPQPLEYFAGANAPARLTRFKEKVRALEKTGLDRVLVLKFDERLSQIEASEFVEELLVHRLGVKSLMAGTDFRFGRDAFGNLTLLKTLGKRHEFEVLERETFVAAGGRVSSSWIRDALANGELALAAELLGRPYAMSGRVQHGKRLGRTIGYPTANISPRRIVSPLSGIYVVTVSGLGDSARPGVASIGTRPTVNGVGVLLEVHLFDFSSDIYGREVCVNFLRKLRDEVRFDSLEIMTAQIDEDARQARQYFEDSAADR